MNYFKQLWADESGFLLSTEAIMLGSVAAVGVTAAVSTMASSVNDELNQSGLAIRCLDQSYEIPAQHANGSFVAGSRFQQQPVERSQADLRDQISQIAEGARNAAAYRSNAGEVARILRDNSGLSAAAVENRRKEKRPQQRTRPNVNPAPDDK